MNNEKYQACTNCVMDTSDREIFFNEDGLCRHCIFFNKKIKPNWDTCNKGLSKAKAIANRIKREGIGKDFDCILGLSGGLDSSYLAYIAKEKLGIRPLVFHVDAGWNSQQAVNNIEKIVDALDLDLFTEVIDWEEMRDLQLAFFKSGVDHIDTPQDHVFGATMYKFASKYNIKYILNGGNYSTECVVNPLEWHYHASDLTQLQDIHNKFGTIPLKSLPLCNLITYKLIYRLFKGMKVIKLLNYMPYNKKDATEFMTNSFGWQTYPQKHFESRFTKFYEGYWQPKKFGVDKRRVQFSSLILSGQMTRQEALNFLRKPPYDDEEAEQDFEYVATKLGISVEELQRYMDQPNKSYRDYKSRNWMIDIGTRVMAVFGSYRGL